MVRDLDECQFVAVNYGKEWYAGVVTHKTKHDVYTVRFNTGVDRKFSGAKKLLPLKHAGGDEPYSTRQILKMQLSPRVVKTETKVPSLIW